MNYLLLTVIMVSAGAANMSAAIAGKFFPGFDYPADFGLKFRKRRILGSHKTIRGVIAGTLTGGFVYLLQLFILNNFSSLTSYLLILNSYLFLGFLLGFGAIAGDMAKSFFKRQINIPPGKSWMPFDQIDWIIGSLIITMPLTGIKFTNIIVCACVGFFFHIIIKLIGFLLKIDKDPI